MSFILVTVTIFTQRQCDCYWNFSIYLILKVLCIIREFTRVWSTFPNELSLVLLLRFPKKTFRALLTRLPCYDKKRKELWVNGDTAITRLWYFFRVLAESKLKKAGDSSFSEIWNENLIKINFNVCTWWIKKEVGWKNISMRVSRWIYNNLIL